MKKLTLVAVCACFLGFVSGCATPTSMSYNMTAYKHQKKIETKENLQKTITVGDVTGACQKRSYWLTTFLTNDELKKAIEKSLKNIYLLNHDNTPKYTLSAHVVSMEQPFAMFNVTKILTISYELTEISSNKTMWRKDITTTATKTTSDSIMAEQRAVLAIEHAVKDNLKKLIQKLKKAEFE